MGSTAAFVAFVALLLLKSEKGEKVLFTAPVAGEINVTALIALFLAVWWGVAMGILTFGGPFTTTSNGYFSVWLGFACSVLGLGVTLPALYKVAASSASDVLGAPPPFPLLTSSPLPPSFPLLPPSRPTPWSAFRSVPGLAVCGFVLALELGIGELGIGEGVPITKQV